MHHHPFVPLRLGLQHTHWQQLFFANTGLVILDTAPVNIGNNVLIGPQVGIYAAYHPLDVATRIAGYEAAKPVTICDDVWIGGHVSILPGVTIGRGAVIGAGSVVTHSIPPGVVAAGNPCRIIKKPASAHNTGSRKTNNMHIKTARYSFFNQAPVNSSTLYFQAVKP